MKIVVVGTGYVGLVTGACFAEMGYFVTCLDIDEAKINGLKSGRVPFYEPGLEEIVIRNSEKKRLHFTTDYKEALSGANICFLALPTPSREDGSCDISFIEKAAQTVAQNMDGPLVVVTKSTVPVGTSFSIKKIIADTLKGKFEIEIVSNPEFLKEGCAVSDCMKPDRIVIGVQSEKAARIMRELYAPFCVNREKIIEMDILSSEMTKYAANCMLASRISFMNEIANICKKVGANINEVRKGIGSDTRIGHSFLYAGIGYGGSCFPKDVTALISMAERLGLDAEILKSVDRVNKKMRLTMIKNIMDYFQTKGGIRDKTLTIWGLSFKPDTDDMREAPSLTIIERLLKEGAYLRLYDPIAMENAKRIFKGYENSEKITWCRDEFEASSNSHGIALLTEWKQFRLIDFKSLAKSMKGKVIFDGRNQYKSHEIRTHGFDYVGVGVPDG